MGGGGVECIIGNWEIVNEIKRKRQRKTDDTISVFFELWMTVKSSAPHQKFCYVEELFNKK